MQQQQVPQQLRCAALRCAALTASGTKSPLGLDRSRMAYWNLSSTSQGVSFRCWSAGEKGTCGQMGAGPAAAGVRRVGQLPALAPRQHTAAAAQAAAALQPSSRRSPASHRQHR